MNVTRYVVSYEVAKAISGKFKPNLKDKRKAYIALTIMAVFGFVLFAMGVGTMFSGDIGSGLMLFVGGFAFVYLICLSPWTQNPNNYRFEINEGEPIEALRVYYKGKLVSIDFVVDEDGKVRFASNESKHSCVRWADGTHMSQFTTYRIINVFMKHMADINMLSDSVTVTFE